MNAPSNMIEHPPQVRSKVLLLSNNMRNHKILTSTVDTVSTESVKLKFAETAVDTTGLHKNFDSFENS
jgi:hypothetical protein